MEMNGDMCLCRNIPRSVIEATSDVTQLVLDTPRRTSQGTQKNPTTMLGLDQKNRPTSHIYKCPAFGGLSAHVMSCIFECMECAHPPQYPLTVQSERHKASHQYCLESGPCSRNMAGYLRKQQKHLDACELKKKAMLTLVLVS